MTYIETLFYAESEGLLPTRMGKINAVINEIKNHSSYIIDLFEFKKILQKYGLSYEELSNKELEYINYKIK
jgi:hypothetical protein